MADLNTGQAVQIGGATAGELVGEFSDYDGLIEALRQRAVDIGLSYRVLDELAGFA
jgi:hypothetical protein